MLLLLVVLSSSLQRWAQSPSKESAFFSTACIDRTTLLRLLLLPSLYKKEKFDNVDFAMMKEKNLIEFLSGGGREYIVKACLNRGIVYIWRLPIWLDPRECIVGIEEGACKLVL